MTSPTPSVRDIGRGTAWSVVNNVSGQGLALLIFLITARFVSKEAFGLMAISILVVEAFRQIVINSLSGALLAKKNPENEDYNACFILVLATSTISAILVFIFAGPLADLLRNKDLAEVLQLVCLMIFSSGLSKTHETWLSRHLRFKSLALRSVVSLVIGGAVGITMAVKGYGLMSLVTQQLLTSFTSVVFLWAATEWRPSFRIRWENIKGIASYSKHLAVSATTNFANTQADVFFSSYYLGATTTGVYNAAKRIIVAMNTTVSQSLNAVSLPVFANIVGTNDQALPRAFSKATMLTSLLTAPVFAGIFVLSGDAISILIGENWLDAAPILSALVPAAYLATIGQYNHNVFLVHAKPHWQSALVMIYAACNIALFIFVARYGAVALAAAYSARAVLLYPLSVGMALSLLKIPAWQYIKQILPSVAAAIVMAVCLYGLKQEMQSVNTFLRVAVLVPVGAAIYIPLVALMDRSVVGEIRHIISQMFKKE